jgi:hypothetical protein
MKPGAFGSLTPMTNDECIAMRALLYFANLIATEMDAQPDLTARQIAGSASNPDDPLAQLFRAITAARKIIAPYPPHADEVTS